jgi:lipoprotein NlpI
LRAFFYWGTALVFASGAAFADWSADVEMCFERTGSIAMDVDVCSRAIRSGELEAENLATMYRTRGQAYNESGAYDLAIADFDQALKLNPYSATSLRRRGEARHGLGQYDRALADFDQAIELSPNFSGAFRDRGTTYFFQGEIGRAGADYDMALGLNSFEPMAQVMRGLTRYMDGHYPAAAEDFRKAMGMAFPYPLAHLWTYLAVRRAGKDGAAELRRNAEEVDRSLWPGPLFRVYLGKLDAADALKAADKSGPKLRQRRQVQAHYFLSMLEQSRGRATVARAHFEATLETGAKHLVEYVAARIELERAKP